MAKEDATRLDTSNLIYDEMLKHISPSVIESSGKTVLLDSSRSAVYIRLQSNASKNISSIAYASVLMLCVLKESLRG